MKILETSPHPVAPEYCLGVEGGGKVFWKVPFSKCPEKALKPLIKRFLLNSFTIRSRSGQKTTYGLKGLQVSKTS